MYCRRGGRAGCASARSQHAGPRARLPASARAAAVFVMVWIGMLVYAPRLCHTRPGPVPVPVPVLVVVEPTKAPARGTTPRPTRRPGQRATSSACMPTRSSSAESTPHNYAPHARRQQPREHSPLSSIAFAQQQYTDPSSPCFFPSVYGGHARMAPKPPHNPESICTPTLTRVHTLARRIASSCSAITASACRMNTHRSHFAPAACNSRGLAPFASAYLPRHPPLM